ncbi:MAG: quinone-dependent dihydroorotate dehydrogenase [Angustibacter sp.]
MVGRTSSVARVLAEVGYRAGRPVLLRLPPERAHDLTLGALAGWSALGAVLPSRPRDAAGRPPAVRLLGLDFPSRVGLAAGMDKDGRALGAWPALGLGFVEVGTVTAYPQPGNPRPRLFRLPRDEALINRMGFNNAGSAALAARLARRGRYPVPLGISIGKSRRAPVADAIEDYLTSLRRLHRYADYVAVNVSSPNTPGLRSLQEPDVLRDLLDALAAAGRELSAASGRTVPLLVKVAPDLTTEALQELVQVCLEHQVAGLIAGNTTVSRDGLRTTGPVTQQAGGLSGAPVAARALQAVRVIRRTAGAGFPVIGVGGIRGPDDARRMLDAGADLLQVYTGLVFRGPALIRTVSAAVDGVRAPAPAPGGARGSAGDQR